MDSEAQHHLVILTSSFEPWRIWDRLLSVALEQIEQPFTVVDFNEFVLTSNDEARTSLYLCRSNTPQAKCCCTLIASQGGVIVNGPLIMSPWPRISLRVLAEVGLPLPIAYFGFNLSALHATVHEQSYPLVHKPTSELQWEPQVITTEGELMDRAAKWSLGCKIPEDPFYFEKFVDFRHFIKIYVIGNELFAYQRFEYLGYKSVDQTPIPYELPKTISETILYALRQNSITVASLDILMNSPDGEEWVVVDINLVPIYRFLPNAATRLASHLAALARNL